MGILNSLKHFAAPAAAPVFLNLGIIGATFLITPYFSEPVIGTALGVLIGGILQVMLQLPWIYKNGVSLKPMWNPGHPAVNRIGMLILPALFGSAVYQINQFVGTLLASFLPVGSISWLYYADRLVELPLGVFAIAISTAALPSLSRQAVEKDRNAFRDTLEHSLRLTFFISIPSMAGLIVLGKPIIQLFFQRGAFDIVSRDMTAYALFYYALGLWAFSGVKIVVSAFYALQDTVTPVKVSVVTFFSYIVFGITLMGPLKHGGLALALSLSSALNFTLLIFLLKRKLPAWKLSQISLSVLKVLLSAAVMGISVFCLKTKFFTYDYDPGILNLGLEVFFLVTSGIIIYMVSAVIFRCGELRSIMDLVKSRK
jgi:putative peptidoglycan lipid II flippase